MVNRLQVEILPLAQKQGGVNREGPRGSSTRLGRQKPIGHDQVDLYQPAKVHNINLSALSRTYSLSSNSCRPRTPLTIYPPIYVLSLQVIQPFYVNSRPSCFGPSIARAISHQLRRWLPYHSHLTIYPPPIGIGYLLCLPMLCTKGNPTFIQRRRNIVMNWLVNVTTPARRPDGIRTWRESLR